MDISQSRTKLQARSWFAVVQTYQECNRRYARLLKPFGLTITQFDVMIAIHRLGDRATPNAIAEELLVTRGNITGVLHRLQDSDLISTRRHEADGRSFVCVMTAEGQALMNQARHAASRFIAAQLSPFDEKALRQTERQMNEMREHLLSVDPDAIAAEVLALHGDGHSEGSGI